MESLTSYNLPLSIISNGRVLSYSQLEYSNGIIEPRCIVTEQDGTFCASLSLNRINIKQAIELELTDLDLVYHYPQFETYVF